MQQKILMHFEQNILLNQQYQACYFNENLFAWGKKVISKQNNYPNPIYYNGQIHLPIKFIT